MLSLRTYTFSQTVCRHSLYVHSKVNVNSSFRFRWQKNVMRKRIREKRNEEKKMAFLLQLTIFQKRRGRRMYSYQVTNKFKIVSRLLNQCCCCCAQRLLCGMANFSFFHAFILTCRCIMWNQSSICVLFDDSKE